MSHAIIGYTCPNCGYRGDTLSGVDATGHGGGSPRPGSITMCLRCGMLETYGPSMVRRPLSLAEFDELDADTRRLLFAVDMSRVLALLAKVGDA